VRQISYSTKLVLKRFYALRLCVAYHRSTAMLVWVYGSVNGFIAIQTMSLPLARGITPTVQMDCAETGLPCLLFLSRPNAFRDGMI
jgi:hypothetical protein